MAALSGPRPLALLGLLYTFVSLVLADTCTRGDYNLTALHAFSPWYMVTDSTNVTFKISLCDKLAPINTPQATNCPDGTSVCLSYTNGTAVSYGNYSSNPSVLNSTDTESRSNGELVFMLKGQPCLAKTNEFYSTFFYFKCGKTLGHPYYVGDLWCSVHIEWESYIFCKKLPVPDTEVPCTLVRDGHLIDLSPLIKTSGGYLVDEDNQNDRKIFINVCRDITPGTATDDGTHNCPRGSASCKVAGNTTVDFGKPSKGLEATSSGVRLVYTSREKPAGCLEYPSTTITFRCPQRGGSREPTLLSNFLCSVEVVWLTEFACPVDHISSKTCQLTMEQHDIHVDLSPLSRHQFTPYTVNVTDGQDHYQYLINICDTLGSTCGASKKGPSVCQTKANDETFFYSLGENAYTTLRYSDNKLTMILKHGDACRSNFKRETLIDFFCNKTAVDDGIGYPEFVEHSNCSYFFKWDTKYACPQQTPNGTCSIVADGKKFDLSPLIKETGTNWVVITGDNEDSDKTIFLNVCHDVLNIGEASQCPPGSAVCRKGSTAAASLGQYTQSLQYDVPSKSLRLTYTEGDHFTETTQGCKAHTTIRFVCTPGKLDGVPRLVSKTQDDCYHEIEWQTSVACVLHHKTGDGCRVFDDDAGYMFDLNPLTYPNGSYTVTGSDGYNYLINVCAAVKYQNFCSSPPHDNAAICQVKLGSTSNEQKKVAEPTSRLEYFDGVLNLTYTNGEPYNNADHTPRMAEIAFICDQTADKGKPEFLEERNFTYAFLWRSSYACPTAPMECVVTDPTTHSQYDLSSLARMSQNWQIEGLDDSGNKNKFYINVCRPLRPIPGVQCSSLASVCATSFNNGKETLLHGNLGGPEAGPQVETSTHGVRLVYTHGDTCHDSQGTVGSFRTTIHFTCVPGQVAGGPAAPQLVSPCEYSILWETAAACPVSSVQSPSVTCQVKDPNTDFVFNLQPLYRPQGYNVSTLDASRSFQVSICGSLPDSACGKFDNKSATTVCEVGHNGNMSVAMLGSELKYSTDGEMKLSYSGHISRSQGGAASKFVLNFVCDRTAQAPIIRFDGQTFLSTTFTVSTALACPPQPVSCVTQDSQGRQFDLTALARQTGNWRVIDTRPTHKDLSYHINVCRPVNPTPDMTCPGGAVGACQTGISGNFSMGYIQSEPVVSTIDGVVTIRYDGGDKCHVGTASENFRSTRIIFFCDHVEHEPVFEGESINCEYTFVWRTPSACPQQVITGSDCKVTDPLYNFEFDLSQLRRSSDDYNISANGYHFLLNVCGPLVKGPGQCGTATVSACQTGPTLQEPIHIGTSNDKPMYNMGQISLVYKEGKGSCHQTFTRSTIINFICDHSQTGNTSPQYVSETSDCTYVFEWHTSAACPPHQISDCTFQYGKDVFDLSRLTRVDDNYERVYSDSQKSYIINVCRSLVHKKDQMCPFNAAACMIDLSQTDIQKRFHNIGEVTSHSISYDHGTLMLRYDNGELCTDGKTRSSTVILFYCDPSTDALGTPDSHFTRNLCEEHFVWTSSAACPLQRRPDNTTGSGNCQVTNFNTGYVFDLSALQNSSGYRVYDRQGHEFTLNVCAGLGTSSPCRNGTGSCQVPQTGDKTGVSAGQANAHLIYRDGVVMLNYSNGDTCDTGRAARTTYINFVCVPGAGTGQPVYIDQSGDCLYYFDWQTQLVCETELVCEVTTDAGYTLDLSPLVKKSGKYNVLVNSANQLQGVIYINLCRPLNPIYGTLCPAGSGACLVTEGQKPLSLGHVDMGPVWDSMLKHVKLTYTNGDPCPSNPKVNMTSVILLSCGSSEQLEPQLESVTDDCQYIFMWQTTLACEKGRSQQLTSNCTFYDYLAQMSYNLSSLSESVSVPSSHGGSYLVRVCGHLEEKGEHGEASCSQSSVCLTAAGGRDGSFGSSSQGVFHKDTHFVGLTFSGGRTCHTAKAASTIYFECDHSAGTGLPEIFDEESECEVTFRWRTSLVCPMDRKQCLIASSKRLYDFSLLSQDSGSWNLTDPENNTYWLNLCQGVHGSAITAGCPSGAAVCRKTSDGKVQMLGQLDTQLISISEGPKPTITVKYMEGDADACNVGRRRRSGITPQVIVNLSCGDTLGSPAIHQHSADSAAQCVFEFTWKTRMACDDDFTIVPVIEKNGFIVDARTNLAIDLRPLISLKNHEREVGNKKFLISLGGPVPVGGDISGCQGAAICLLTPESKSARNLGTFSSKAFYMQDAHLEAVFTSQEKCAGSQGQHNVTTTIKFNCDPAQVLGRPELFYQSQDCAYIFTWGTSLVCLDAFQSAATLLLADEASGSWSAGGGAVGATKIAIGVSVFMAIVVACVLILVLHKPERRAVILSRLKSVILCRQREENPIVYSRLSQSEHEDSAIDGFHDPFNPFEPDEESEINNSQLPVRPSTYHDDSDEDMLL